MKKKSAIILTYIMILFLLIIASASINKAINTLRLTQRDALYTEGLYLAEGGISRAAFIMADNIANYIAEPPVGGDYFNVTENNFLNSVFTVQYWCTPLEGNRTMPGLGGITTFERNYRISAVATHPQSDVTVRVNQLVVRRLTPTFQHAVFYADDLEMLPGPDMILSGRVHSNHDIYIGTHNTFTIDTEYLYTAGDIYNRRKDGSQEMSGDVSIKITGSLDYALMMEAGDIDPLDSDRADWTDESQLRWNGTVKSTVHGVTSLAVPAVASIQPGGFYAQNAGLSIIKTSGGSWQITSGASSLGINDFPPDTITETTFYDNREGTTVTVIDIDMEKLNASGYFPSNGLLYAAREDSSALDPNGVRLTNGSQLDGPLTVVSGGPVYIQGDYNNDTKQPAAVICDALNILSNSWDDALSSSSLDSRVASDTTVNAALISGIVATAGSSYSGGLENYPRLHEKWTGKTLFIRGSFVELWESVIARGLWHYGSPIYTAPWRDWNYDTDFNDFNKLPPFTPYAVETEPLAWWVD
jgi:hypothetical protein